MDDTGTNVPETVETLLLQQVQLVSGKRKAQMFPKGTRELMLPDGLDRVETERGVFHFNSRAVSRDDVIASTKSHRENEILGLGPYNKSDILRRMRDGEGLLAISEIAPNGTEIKAAAATESTIVDQWAAFDAGKLPMSTIRIEPIDSVIKRRQSHGI